MKYVNCLLVLLLLCSCHNSNEILEDSNPPVYEMVEDTFEVLALANNEAVNLSNEEKMTLRTLLMKTSEVKEDYFTLSGEPQYKIMKGNASYYVYPFENIIVFKGDHLRTLTLRDDIDMWLAILGMVDDDASITFKTWNQDDEVSVEQIDTIGALVMSGLKAKDDGYDTHLLYFEDEAHEVIGEIRGGNVYLFDGVNDALYHVRGIDNADYFLVNQMCGGISDVYVVCDDHRVYQLYNERLVEEDGTTTYEVYGRQLKLTFEFKALTNYDDSTPYTTCGFPNVYAVSMNDELRLINEDGTLGERRDEWHPYVNYIWLDGGDHSYVLYIYNDHRVGLGRVDYENGSEVFLELIKDELGETIHVKAYAIVLSPSDDENAHKYILFISDDEYVYIYNDNGEYSHRVKLINNFKMKDYKIMNARDNSKSEIIFSFANGAQRVYEGAYGIEYFAVSTK